MSMPPNNASRVDKFEWARSQLMDMQHDLDNGHVKATLEEAQDFVKVLRDLIATNPTY